MKQLTQNMRSGKTEVVEVPVPIPGRGTALVRTAASLVSTGTERMVVEFAEKSLVGKARSRPDLARQVISKARTDGVLPTVKAAFNRLSKPLALGYSSAGTIVELGEGMNGFHVGQRVACAGGGYAVHGEYAVIPKKLLTLLPEEVSFEDGAFTTLGAIAMHGFRLAGPQLGERVAVIGLGLVGLLSVGIATAAGCKVLGIDLDEGRAALTKELGGQGVIRKDAEEAVRAFSKGQGADVVLICAATKSNDPIELAGEMARDRARVIAVGSVGMRIPRKQYFDKELTFLVSRSYGPGRYDLDYEEAGQDYPIGYVRWTEGRNLDSFVELLSNKKIDLSPLISHRFVIEKASEAYNLITGKTKKSSLGVLITYPDGDASLKDNKIKDKGIPVDARTIEYNQRKQKKVGGIRLGVIGAGNFAGGVMLPIWKRSKHVELVGIGSRSGLSAQQAAKRFGVGYATSDMQKIINDPAVNVIAILTRHNLHASLIASALDAGKHVFCEKPLAVDQEGLRAVQTAIENPQAKLLTVGFNRRFAPLSVKMKKFIDRRQEPLVAHYRVNAGYLPPEHWLHDPEQGGGRIVGEACHFVDFLAYLVGEKPNSVYAQALPNNGMYIDDNVIMTFTFLDGSVGTVSYLANGDKSLGKERVEVFAGGRVAILDDYRSLRIVRDGMQKTYRTRWRQDKGHRAEWMAFQDAILVDQPAPISYDHLIGVTRATFAAVEALKKGDNIRI